MCASVCEVKERVRERERERKRDSQTKRESERERERERESEGQGVRETWKGKKAWRRKRLAVVHCESGGRHAVYC